MVLSYARGDERKENKIIYLKKEKGKKRTLPYTAMYLRYQSFDIKLNKAVSIKKQLILYMSNV